MYLKVAKPEDVLAGLAILYERSYVGSTPPVP